MKLLSNKIKTFRAIAITVALGAACSNAMAATAIIDPISDQLNGFNGVNISGYGVWDATFSTHWLGNSYTDEFANAAAAELYNMFTNGSFQGGIYDIDASKTLDCTSQNTCSWSTASVQNPGNPLNLISYSFANFGQSFEPNDTYGLQWQSLSDALSGVDNSFVYVSWSQNEVPPVPIPAAAFMFAPALLGFIGLRRKAKNSVT